MHCAEIILRKRNGRSRLAMHCDHRTNLKIRFLTYSSNMNINDTSAIRECTSCQMCAAVCSRDAISIHLNEDGFYRPYIDEGKCTNCGLCTKVCYKFDNDIRVTDAEGLNNVKVYSAQHKSEELLEKVTSGGVADALAKELVRQGYTCIGVTYNDDNHRAEHKVARNENETDAFRGSKYIQSYSLDAFKEMVKGIRDEKYAVFGLPCHIYAAHKFLTMRKQREKCLLIDLFCHGCPSMLVWSKYEQRIKEKVNKKKFDEVQFRSKVRGWGTFYVVVVVVDGVKAFISSPKQDEFYSLFFSDHVLNDACSDCKLRSTMEYTENINKALSIIKQCSSTKEDVRLFNSLSYIGLDVEKSVPLLNELYNSDVEISNVEKIKNVKEF